MPQAASRLRLKNSSASVLDDYTVSLASALWLKVGKVQSARWHMACDQGRNVYTIHSLQAKKHARLRRRCNKCNDITACSLASTALCIPQYVAICMCLSLHNTLASLAYRKGAKHLRYPAAVDDCNRCMHTRLHFPCSARHVQHRLWAIATCIPYARP